MRQHITGYPLNQVDARKACFEQRATVNLLLGIVLLGICVVAGCGPASTEAPALIRPVKTMVVTAGRGTQIRVFPGKVEATKRVELAFQVSGLIVNLPIKEGQKVAKGEVIASLRLDDFQAPLKSLLAQLDQARASLRALQAGERIEERTRREAAVRAAEARLANARSNLDRSTQLLQSRTISREVFEANETALRVATEEHKAAVQLLEKGTIGRQEDIEAQEAAVRSLEARVVVAELQLNDATLRAPYDGVIARRLVEVNQNIRAKEPVVQFQDVDEIDIQVDVPETIMAADLRTADIVRLAAEFSAAPGVEFPVQVREIAQVADPVTQTFQVRATMLAPPDIRLLPGMTANVTLEYRRARVLGEQIQVPISAIYKSASGEQIVWVIGNDQTAIPRPVKLGAASGGMVEIISGLAVGDRIAIAGVTQIRQGMKVRDLGNALGGGNDLAARGAA
ncbi:MAG: efflux RND transporter periplasmic adaptor subunit [Pirellulales bacterium]|nr:efflux RND transporter periplasmic adaptor subunit [Pirellulales bacterium]